MDNCTKCGHFKAAGEFHLVNDWPGRVEILKEGLPMLHISLCPHARQFPSMDAAIANTPQPVRIVLVSK